MTEASFSPILCWSQKKKKVLCLSSASFLCDLYDIPERGAVNRSCLWILVGKDAGFWREKKHRNSQKFSAKIQEKISHFSHFFALVGNTVCDFTCSKIQYWCISFSIIFWLVVPVLLFAVRCRQVCKLFAMQCDMQIELSGVEQFANKNFVYGTVSSLGHLCIIYL